MNVSEETPKGGLSRNEVWASRDSRNSNQNGWIEEQRVDFALCNNVWTLTCTVKLTVLSRNPINNKDTKVSERRCEHK